MTRDEYAEKEIELYEQRTGITLDAHNRSTYRDMMKKEFNFFEYSVDRVDNNNSHDDIWINTEYL